MLTLVAARKKKADVQERQITLLLPLMWRDYVHELAQRLGCDLQSVYRAALCALARDPTRDHLVRLIDLAGKTRYPEMGGLTPETAWELLAAMNAEALEFSARLTVVSGGADATQTAAAAALAHADAAQLARRHPARAAGRTLPAAPGAQRRSSR